MTKKENQRIVIHFDKKAAAALEQLRTNIQKDTHSKAYRHAVDLYDTMLKIQLLTPILDRDGNVIEFPKPVPTLAVSSLIIPETKVAEGVLVKSQSYVWAAVVKAISENWELAYSIPPEKWEELVAGAFKKAGFEKVVLTPRSGDLGRDVIAISKGVGCVKIIGSVKAYKPGHLVKQDDVRALLGVMSGEQNVSKGIVATTSDFAPRISSDRFIKPFLPTRLELLNGRALKDWLSSLAKTPR